jgi:two-component system, cell cycle sensor histidine kinase and response regulator CckA
MTGNIPDHHLDLLEQRFRVLQERARSLPEPSRKELDPALQELSLAIEAVRAAREARFSPPDALPGSREAPDVPGPCETILHHIFNAIPDLLTISEGRFRTFIEGSPESVFLTDIQETILAASRVAAQRLGKNLQEVIGASAFDLFPPEVASRRRDSFEKAIATRRPVRFEDARGNYQFDNHINPILDAEGKVSMLSILAVDITDRKLAKRSLEESEERFRILFDYAPDAYILADAQGEIIDCNKATEKLAGYDREELIGNNFACLPWLDFRQQVKLADLLTQAARGEVLGPVDFTLTRKDGGEVIAEGMNLPLSIQGQNLVLTIVRDITARQQAETELRESEQRFRLMAETIQDVFWLATLDIGKIVYVSPAYELVWGRTYGELYQSPLSFMETIHPEDRKRVRAEILEGRKQGTPWSHEYRIIRPDGGVRWIRDRGFPVRDDRGRLLMFTGVASDITERKALEEQLLQAQKMEAVGRLAGGVAHDFNNLLMAIMGYGELMKGKVLAGDPLHGYLQDILKATDRAVALTQQLLTFSRRQILKPQLVDLNRVVLDLKKMLERLIGEDLDLEIVTAPELGPVKVDPGQLSQIIMNLVVNARDAMPRGGRLSIETVNIDIKASRHTGFGPAPPGPYVRLTVRDTGVGMDEATRAHIFEPFFTTKEPGRGTGLGLSIVYGIVKQSGGYIDVKSAPGEGSSFMIYLPRLKGVMEPPREEIPVGKGFQGEGTILLVEDEDVLRTLLGKFLRLHGYTVLEAHHGGEALLICERHQGPLHLMVTDVVMPHMGGRELADRVTPLFPDMKVLYMSGYTEDAMVHCGVADLKVPFLQKPFKPIELARKIRAILHPPVSRSRVW